MTRGVVPAKGVGGEWLTPHGGCENQFSELMRDIKEHSELFSRNLREARILQSRWWQATAALFPRCSHCPALTSKLEQPGKRKHPAGTETRGCGCIPEDFCILPRNLSWGVIMMIIFKKKKKIKSLLNHLYHHCLSLPGLSHPKTINWVSQTIGFTSNSSGVWEVQGQGVSQFTYW